MNAAKFFLIATVLVACAMAVFAQDPHQPHNIEARSTQGRTKRFPFAAAYAAPVAYSSYSYPAFGAYPYAAYSAYPYAYPAFF